MAIDQILQQLMTGGATPQQGGQLPPEIMAAISQTGNAPIDGKRSKKETLQLMLAGLADLFSQQASIRNQQAGGGAIASDSVRSIRDRRDARSQRQEQQAFRQQQLDAQIASNQSAATDRSTGLVIQREAAGAAAKGRSAAAEDRKTGLAKQQEQLEFDRQEAKDDITRRRMEHEGNLLVEYGKAGGTEPIEFGPDDDFAERSATMAAAYGRLAESKKSELTERERLAASAAFEKRMDDATLDLGNIMIANPTGELRKKTLQELRDLRTDILGVGKLYFSDPEERSLYDAKAGGLLIDQIDVLIDEKSKTDDAKQPGFGARLLESFLGLGDREEAPAEQAAVNRGSAIENFARLTRQVNNPRELGGR